MDTPSLGPTLRKSEMACNHARVPKGSSLKEPSSFRARRTSAANLDDLDTLPSIRARIAKILETPGFNDQTRQNLVDQFGVIDDMDFDRAGNLTIFRATTTTMDRIAAATAGQNLGVLLSHQNRTAIAYDALGDRQAGQINLLIQARLAANQFAREGVWDLRALGENKVSLNPGTPLVVTGLWLAGKPIKLPSWLCQSFKA